MPTTTKASKARSARKPEKSAEIRVRLAAKTKDKVEKLFKRHGLTAAGGVRRLIDNAITEDDPWFAHAMSSHLPNAESLKAIEDALADEGEEITLEDLRRQWEET